MFRQMYSALFVCAAVCLLTSDAAQYVCHGKDSEDCSDGHEETISCRKPPKTGTGVRTVETNDFFNVVITLRRTDAANTACRFDMRVHGKEGTSLRQPVNWDMMATESQEETTLSQQYHGEGVGVPQDIYLEGPPCAWKPISMGVSSEKTGHQLQLACDNLQPPQSAPENHYLLRHRRSAYRSLKVSVKTSGSFQAGTDADVYIYVRGRTSSSGKTWLSGSFETGDWDSTWLSVGDIGIIHQITIGHNDKGFGSGWKLDKVEITESGEGTYRFGCSCWLEDGTLSRSISVSSECSRLQGCSSQRCVTCDKCEGTVNDSPGYRAFRLATDRRTCEKLCSWRTDSSYCYPGACGNELEEQCTCAEGFTGKNCKQMEEPVILFNHLVASTSGVDSAEAPADVNTVINQENVWTNVKDFAKLSYSFKSKYIPPGVAPERPPFITDYSVGIIKGEVTYKFYRGEGNIMSDKTHNYPCAGASESSPSKTIFVCGAEVDSIGLMPSHLLTGDIIEMTFTTANGGYVVIRDLERNTDRRESMSGQTKSVNVRLGLDYTNPYHCLETDKCSVNMLKVPKISSVPQISVEWDGWKDDMAGIDHYVITAFDMEYMAGDGGLRTKKLSATEKINSTDQSGGILLPGAGLYGIEISTFDKAGNSRSSRRIMIYESDSVVETTHESVLRVTSAAETASWDWQWTSESITIDWNERYINRLHMTNKWLERALPVANVDELYDDHNKSRGIDAIPNVQAIVEYQTSFLVDHEGGETILETPDNSTFTSRGIDQLHTISPPLVDGDTVRYWIRAFDIRREYLEENITVHIDTSPPIIQNLWLTREDRLNVSVHNIEELDKMTIEWESFDEHSGLETVSWRVFDNFTGEDVIHGIEHLTNQGNVENMADCEVTYITYPRGSDCYCTPGKGCYHRHYQVKPRVLEEHVEHGGIFQDKNTGVHDHDYFLEVNVMNHAKLNTTLRFQITIDASAPYPGVVHDGQIGTPEVDYQNGLQMHAHWDGFFDKESGVKFYQYGFGNLCLQDEDFGLDLTNKKINETYSTHAAWSAPSEGKFYITVVAYNRAVEPSTPVCSDGVTIDKTGPVLSQIAVDNSRTYPGLVATSTGDVWLVSEDRRRSKINFPGPDCISKTIEITDDDLSLFPRLKDYKGDLVFQTNLSCSDTDLFLLDSFKTFYLFKEHMLFVNWTCEDEESGIHDYQVALMSSPSDVDAPDILPFTSTHQHPHYHGYYPALSDGQQFHIAVKAINRAGLEQIQLLGPGIVHTQPAGFMPPLIVSLQDKYLVGSWSNSTFSDPLKDALHYQFAIGSSPGRSDVMAFRPLQSKMNCSSTTPPSCTEVNIDDLQWDLHHSHTYYMSVKVTNIVGLSTIAVSEPYQHNVRLPSHGVVLDVNLENEQELFETTEFDDTDFQLSTTSLHTKWYGFDDGLGGVTYRVCVGTAPGSEDVRGWEDTNEEYSHTFENLELVKNTKFYVTVAATNRAGVTKSSSDGVTILQNNQRVPGLSVFDGLACTETDDRIDCDEGLSFQTSVTSYAAHWTVQDKQPMRPAYVALEKQSRNFVWKLYQDYEYVGTGSNVSFGGLRLEAGHTYRAGVRFCAGHVCSSPVYTDGVTVVPHLPVSDGVQLVHTETGTNSRIEVLMSPFHDPDIVDESLAAAIMDRYEWSLTDNSHSGNTLIPWTPVHRLAKRDGKDTFTIDLPGNLSFTKCLRIAVRGYTLAGAYSIVTKDVKDCHKIDPANIIPSVVIDAVGSKRGVGIGRGIRLRKNARWGRADADYTPYSNILSAVWPTLRYNVYEFAVISGDDLDPAFHYQKENIMAVGDPCSIPGVIKCGYAGENFINVEFGEGQLKHGQRFHICIHAEERKTMFEKWGTSLPEIRACSDGITVDLTPPTPGTVTVHDLLDSAYQSNSEAASLSWEGFTDVEEAGPISHHSGISHYMLALGSLPGSEDVRVFTDVGLVDQYRFTGLLVQDGQIVYATVKAVDFVGEASESYSGGFIIDSSPPQRTMKQVQLENAYITSTTFSLCWEGVLVDYDSGIKFYEVSLGTSSGTEDTSARLQTTEHCHTFEISNILSGHPLFVTVKAHNYAGLYTVYMSHALTVDLSPPSVGHVYDGLLIDARRTTMDKDYVTSIERMGAHWEGFHDPHSSIEHYTVKVGTCPGCEDTVMEFMNSARTDVVFGDQHLVFTEGTKYYVTVTACNKAGLCSSATSDGVILDQSPPVPGRVQDGTQDRDIQFQGSRTFLGCKWTGFQDPESSIHYYEWWVGTSPSDKDILSEQNTAKHELGFITLPSSKKLPVGKMLYCTARAHNEAGLYTDSTSNGLVVDDTAPVVVKAPVIEGGQGSLVDMTFMTRSTIRVSWEMEDGESYIEKQFISISSHQLGEFDSSLLQLPGLLKEFTYTQLSLHDGGRYTIKVTCCNMAGLCTSSNTGELLFDSSKPSQGMLAVETDHAARLTRHESRGMTWTDSSMTLSWLGFADLHSGVDHYLVTAGTKPFSSDLNKKGESARIQHDGSGADKEDEGVVQTNTIDTKDLSSSSSVFVTIWAVNGVGLKSDPLHAELTLGAGGELELVRRCATFSCFGHCVCAVRDDKCAVRSACEHLANGGANAVVTVNDVIDLTSLDADSSVDVDFSPSDTCLAATWTVTVDQGLQPLRYEYSVGTAEADSPQGIYKGPHARTWHDAGQTNFIVVPLTPNQELVEGNRYSVFVRVWYSDDSYSIFKSDGVLIDTIRPDYTEKIGRAVKEHKDLQDKKDIDFQVFKDSVLISWDKVFMPGHSDLLKYRVYVSTSPGGHSIHGSGDVSSSNYTVRSLELQSSSVYFSSILAYNNAGLVGWAYSDGVQLDVHKPVSGIVQDGHDLHDVDYQLSASDIKATWDGFSDKDSAVVRYYWCVGTSNNTNDCSLWEWHDVGLATSANIQLFSPLSDGSKVWSKVYALDVVGNKSPVAVSDGLTVDTSPPEIVEEAYLGDNLVLNPSFEEHVEDNRDITNDTYSYCKKSKVTFWESTPSSCVRIFVPYAPHSKQGSQCLGLRGAIQQNISGLITGQTYLLTVHIGYPEHLNNNHKAVEGTVSIGREVFTFSLDPRLCKGTCEMDRQTYILWATQKYTFKAAGKDTSLKIETISKNMEVVVDHVSLHTLQYSYNSDSLVLNKTHLVVHPIYLKHWSSLHAMWHFVDNHSPIVEFTWAVGTVPGGTQIQQFVSVGRHNHGTVTGLRLTHQQKLHLTITARNAAGLTTVSYPDPITVDMTPPVITKCVDGEEEDVDYVKVGEVFMHWEVEDEESQVERCDWAIGTTHGGHDIKPFEVAPDGVTTVTFDFSDVVNSSSLTVYTTVRCFNWVGLMSTATTDGVTVIRVNVPPKTSGIRLIQDDVLYERRNRTCHTTDTMRVHWHPEEVFSTFIEVIDDKSTYQAKVGNHFEFVEFSGLHFTNHGVFSTEVYPETISGVAPDKTTVEFTSHAKPPTVKVNSSIHISKKENHITLSWPDMFSSEWKTLLYKVNIGTVEGATEIVERDIVTAPEITLTLNSDHVKLNSVYLSIEAVDQCGYSAYISKHVHIKLD